MGKVTAKKIYVRDDLTTVDRAILCGGEVLGTGMLVFLGCMGCVGKVVGQSYVIPHLQISFAFGLAIMISVQCFGHISGGHINPAVTIAAAVLGHIPLINVPIYFFGQMLGGIGGFGLLKLVTPSILFETGINPITNSTYPKPCSPSFSPAISGGQACLVEFFLTFILIMVCGAVWDCRNSTKHDSVSIKFGLAVAILAISGGPYSGANMNPARSFGPALFNGDWAGHWVYWIGPLGGGLFGGLLYRFVFSKENVKEENVTLEGTPLNDKS